MEKLFGMNDRKAIAIDPGYISKAGKHTTNIGYFWSGIAGAAKKGLEILGIGIMDIESHVQGRTDTKCRKPAGEESYSHRLVPACT